MRDRKKKKKKLFLYIYILDSVAGVLLEHHANYLLSSNREIIRIYSDI